MAVRVEVFEDRASFQPRKLQLDASGPEQPQLSCLGCLSIDAQEATDTKPQTSRGKRAVRGRAAESPATRIVGGQVSRRGTNHHQIKAGTQVVR